MTLLSAVETEDTYYIAADKITTRYGGQETSWHLRHPKLIVNSEGDLVVASMGATILSTLLRDVLKRANPKTTADLLLAMGEVIESYPFKYSGIEAAARANDDIDVIPGNLLIISEHEGIVVVDAQLACVQLEEPLVAIGPAESAWLGAMQGSMAIIRESFRAPESTDPDIVGLITSAYVIANRIQPTATGASCDILTITK